MQQKHNFHPPTDSNPIEHRNVTFYQNHFRYNDIEYEYVNIKSIFFFIESTKTNHVRNELLINFSILINKKVIVLSTSTHLVFGDWKKSREKAKFLYSFLSEKTLKTRMEGYINKVNKNGFFTYPKGFSIYNNGDIKKGTKFIDNINIASKENRIQFGSTRSNVFGNSRFTNPYEFIIWKLQNKPKPSLFKNYLNINIYYDRDIFEILFRTLLQNGKIV